VTTDSGAAKPANGAAAITDSSLPASNCQAAGSDLPRPHRSPTASACEACREAIKVGLAQGRNAMVIWQGLVSNYGFARSYANVKRFTGKLCGVHSRQHSRHGTGRSVDDSVAARAPKRHGAESISISSSQLLHTQ
jgi:hypothetical protein